MDSITTGSKQDTALLLRLINYYCRCITKLVRNFRSHPSLLTVPKQLFYNNQLDACADQVIHQELVL